MFAIISIVALITEMITVKKERDIFAYWSLQGSMNIETTGPIILSSLVIYAAILPGLLFFAVDYLKKRNWRKTALFMSGQSFLSLSVAAAAWIAISVIHDAANALEHVICDSDEASGDDIMSAAKVAINNLNLIRTKSFVECLFLVVVFGTGVYYYWEKPLSGSGLPFLESY